MSAIVGTGWPSRLFCFAPMLYISIRNDRQQEQFTHVDGPLELGRAATADCKHFVVEDRYVSRSQCRLEELPERKLRITNTGGALKLANGQTVDEDAVVELDLPVQMTAGYTAIEISADPPFTAQPETSLETISRPLTSQLNQAPSSLVTLGESPSAAKLAQWFEVLLSVQRSAAGSAEFYSETSQAVVELVGLDRGLVLLRRGDDWETMAEHQTENSQGAPFSQSVLRRVLEQKRTFFQTPESIVQAASLMQVEAVVAAPIFEQDVIVGVVYGTRDLRSDRQRRGIHPLEAQIVQLLAGAVSAGLARMAKEAEAARMRVQFEQFCSPELTAELERNPNLLNGTDRVISVLFADLRGFSAISEAMGARRTYQLVSDVMDRLTNRVMEQRGVIIDYYGDGLAAMWNAPLDQVDHAELACRAALDMLAELPALNERWAEHVGRGLRIGVGIHSGPAQVGNAGSQRRLKYGPRGHVVNLSSRIEGATKQFGVPILISADTRAALNGTLLTRRLGHAYVVGIQDKVELFELHCQTVDDNWQQLCDGYQQALQLFETGRLKEAERQLADLQSSGLGAADAPTKWLAERTAQASQHSDQPFDPAFRLDQK